jgi:hypothetical protein
LRGSFGVGDDVLQIVECHIVILGVLEVVDDFEEGMPAFF